MTRYSKNIVIIILSLLVCSCEDYLDKAPESDLNKEDVFKDFEHAQGFIEQCNAFVVNYASNIEWTIDGFLLGDEIVPNPGSYKYDKDVEVGALDQYTRGNNYLYNNGVNISSNQSKYRAGIWEGWNAIRIANIVIEELTNPDFKANMSQDEKNLLLGQAYFFRAYFHSEIMKFWGRIPYIDKVLTGNNGDYRIPRPATYKECALRADEDYEKAAELLPEDWADLDGKIDAITINPTTYANSRRRINKAIVYSYKGRNLLYAASPLMHCSDLGISPDKYSYDEDLAEKAAEALAKVIDMANRHVLQLGLADKDHLKYCFTTKAGQGSYFPGTPEAEGVDNQCEYIFSGVAEVPWANIGMGTFMPYGGSVGAGITPNHRFVHNVFGTINGLSCDEDPSHNFQDEFENRDPRFYYNLIIDGDQIIEKPAVEPQYKYARSYTGGYLRTMTSNASSYLSGYFIKKWCLMTRNVQTKGNTIVDNSFGLERWTNMRLTDVYLMYAEALAATSKFGATGTPNFDGINLSSIDVLNLLRDRFNIIHVKESYDKIGVDITNDPHRYMEVVRRERSTEMCFEACRWVDIRRWLIADSEDCKTKSVLDFERDDYSLDHCKRGQFKDINFRERVFLMRTCEYPKHFWLPFKQDEVNMYEGFQQNPGW